MKRIIALVLLLLLAFTFVGCGESEVENGDGNVVFNDLGDFSGQKLEITAIEKGYGVDYIKAAVKVFNKSTGSEIVLKKDETLNESIARTLEVGTDVSDMYLVFSHDYQWVDWSEKGYLVDISNVVSEDRFLNADVAKLGIYKGKRFYYPVSFAPTGIVYNQDYVDMIPSNGSYTQGKFPETFKGLLDLCESCVNAKIMNNGTQVMPMSWGATVSDIFYLIHGMWKSEDPEGYTAYFGQTDVNGIENDANKSLIVNNSFKNVLENLYKLFNPKENVSGDFYPSYSIKDATGQNNLDAEESFLNGYSVFTLSGSWFENEMKDQIEDIEADFYHFSSIPAMKEGGRKASFINLGDYFCVTSKGKNNNIDLAKAFLKFFFSEYSCVTTHSYLQTPIPYKYDMNNVNLTKFGEEVSSVIQNDVLAIAKTDSIVSLSGILDISIMNSDIIKLATSATCNSDQILSKFYGTQKVDWGERLKKFIND